MVKLLGFENFRLTDRNKANADAIFDTGEGKARADFIFYLQGNDCLSIRVGRHDNQISTAQLEEYINENRLDLKRLVKPDVERVRQEARERFMNEQE